MNFFDKSISADQVRSDAGIFVRQTYAYFGAALFLSTIGALFGINVLYEALFGQPWALMSIWIANLFLIFFLSASKKVNTATIIGFFLMAFLSGLGLTGILGYTLATGGAIVVAQAFFLTTTVFAALSIYAFVTKRDFSTWGAALFTVLIVLLVACVLNLVLALFGVYVSWLSMAISYVSAVLFSLYIIYDTQNLIRGAYMTPIQGALSLYLDFYNLFISLLRILNSLRD